MKKQLLLFTIMLLPIVTNADNSGSCGDGVTYYFEEETGTLTISKTGEGTGEMSDYDYSESYSPWLSYSNNILKGIVEEGVTSISDYAFYGCSSMASVAIPDGVTSIGAGAFWACSSLTSVIIPVGVTSIGHSAFWMCGSLASVTIPDGITRIAVA